MDVAFNDIETYKVNTLMDRVDGFSLSAAFALLVAYPLTLRIDRDAPQWLRQVALFAGIAASTAIFASDRSHRSMRCGDMVRLRDSEFPLRIGAFCEHAGQARSLRLGGSGLGRRPARGRGGPGKFRPARILHG